MRKFAKARKKRDAELTPVSKLPAKPFPIVGLGASARGLEAFTELLKHLSTDTGIGFVLDKPFRF
ncbi:MAG: hypothetical protein ABI217_06410 [Chthoniobacterales bacterium]